jgi:cell division protein FtsB
MAVNHDPKSTFESVQVLMKERDALKEVNHKLNAANDALKAENNTLKAARNALEVENNALEVQSKALVAENQRVNENCESAILDYRVARENIQIMEQIISIQSAKQVILWKYIWRLKNGHAGPHVDEDGYWRQPQVPMAPVSEASEPASERSNESIAGSKDSSETKLDPHAVSRNLDQRGFY